MKTTLKAFACIAALAIATPVVAAAPYDVRDLQGARAAGGESTLMSRGYVHIKTRKDYDTSWSYWWNASHKQCLMVGTMDGHYEHVDSTSSSDCNQKDGDGTAAAVAAAAIIGAAILAHNAHDHKERKHEQDERSEADFDAGFRDGQYHHPYTPQGRSDRYADGYEAGTRERDNNSSHRYSDSNNSRRYVETTPYRPSGNAGFSDLQGARAAGADSTLSSRGYSNVDGFKEGYTAYTIWYNRSTHQCVQMAVADGRVDSIVDIQTHPKCR
jgi:hypothetical protein